MKKKRLITSALPYVNNIPHLGNLIQVLSADVFARYCRLAGYETLYVCGTDEYGTATETRALEEGISPKELCDRYYAIHDTIYRWFNISFDKFGRTSTPEHTQITQRIFLGLDRNGYITEHTIQQLFCSSCDRFLADRFVRGSCPHCGYSEARGDQCESCGKLLEPTELVEPKCGVCGSPPHLRETRHLYIDLPAIRPKLEQWIQEASVRGFWARNAVKMTEAWIRDGLKERAITRDLKWGIPVPKKGYENKVFYVWFDAPIGYISITASFTKEWERWWKSPEDTELFQFIGKDNIPFHTVIFPSSLIGSGERWTLLHHISSTEYLNYESGKFSKSKGIGVFGTDAKDTGIPGDVWRFYVFYNRPETSDYMFTWKDFQEKVNSELIGNLGNLVNRTLTFLHRYYGGELPIRDLRQELPSSRIFWKDVKRQEEEIIERFERVELRDAFRSIFTLASYGNKAFQDGEPWKTRTQDPEGTGELIRNLVYLIRDLSILIYPFLPETSVRIASILGTEVRGLDQLGVLSGIDRVRQAEILFSRLEDPQIEELRTRFAGTQKERQEREAEHEKVAEGGTVKEKSQQVNRFLSSVTLVVAKIVKIERHPQAEKLYIETVSTGSEELQIVSGLVPYYKEEELLGKHIILVKNLKPAKLRGILSNGMLLAAEENGVVEVLFAEEASPGTRVLPLGVTQDDLPLEDRWPLKELTIDEFLSFPLRVQEHTVYIAGLPLQAGGKILKTIRVRNGNVR
ncbi:MAG: methionine--tRNA ligase [Spirochaetes bacterium]|nr:methionine--tRNA ligase [Spirochaetota bacterium]